MAQISLNVLPNGAVAIKAHPLPRAEGKVHAEIVLARTSTDFVTWLHVKPDNHDAYCTQGHYFASDLHDAIHDYEDRIGVEYKGRATNG